MGKTDKKRLGRRPTDGAEKIKARRVTIDEKTFLYLRELGGGQLSLGIRKAAKILMSK